jgi:hypothetical protein
MKKEGAMRNIQKMNRRKFIKSSAVFAASAGAAAVLLNTGKFFQISNSLKNPAQNIPQDAKKMFSKCGTCSRTYFSLLNNEFGYPKITEELASDPLAGGLMNTQNQCGMLWGSALAVGAESYRRFDNHSQAMVMAITGTQHVLTSYKKITKSLNCKDVIGVDISKKFEVGKFILKSLPGGFTNMVCMNLAEKWLPQAIQSAKEGLSVEHHEIPELPVSCASEAIKKMGATNEEMVMVSGLAGGMGLSGMACGALGAVIWWNTLQWCRNNPAQSGYNNPKSKEILQVFNDITGSEILCANICGQSFNSIEEHAAYVKNGGCHKLIHGIAQVVNPRV